jgi:gliding motility-associated-like protein
MRRNFYILFLMIAAFLFAANANAEDFWKRVYYNDYGGNSTTDPWLCPTGLSADETHESLEWDDQIRYGYVLTKHWDNNSDWYNGGDHTFPDNREQGYFLIINPGYSDKELTVYRTRLDGLCRGVKFRFTAYVANMVKASAASAGFQPVLAVGVYEGPDPEIKVSENAHQKKTLTASDHSNSDQALDWQELTMDFTMNSDRDYAYFIVSMIQPETNGWDFALDDIKVEVLQPKVEISHNEIFYEDPLTLTASFDNNGFFPDMNNVEYRWEYSTNGNDYTTIKTGKYTDDKNFSYTIDAFDKTKHNGYYRVRIGESGNLESEVCSLVKEIQINETKDNKKVVLCAGEVKVMDDGTVLDAATFKTGDQKKSPNSEITYHITVKEPKTITKEDEYTCIHQVYNGRATEYKGQAFDTEQEIPYSKIYKDEQGCIDSTESWTITVTGERVVKRKDMVICQGEEAYSKTYDTPGVYSEKESGEDNACISYVYSVTVNPTYNMTDTVYLCQGETFNGRVYGENGGPFYDTQVFKTAGCGCDSVVGYTIYVTGKTYTYLEPTTICYGETYVFNGTTYSNPGVYTLEDTYSNSTTGCDSIVQMRLTILDRYENKDNPIDTLICYDSKMFGVPYPNPTTTPILVRDPKTYTSVTGCDSIVWFSLTVLQIQLKLEIKSDRNTVCRGEEVEIYIKELKPKNVPYTWYPDLGGSSTTKKVFTPTGDLDCVVRAERVIDATSTCVSTDTIHVFVREAPTLSVDSINQKENVVTYTVAGGTEPYKIFLDKTEVGSDPYGELHDSPIGTHKLVAMDDNECSDAAYFEITPVPVIPAEYFTPNNDGLNDTWTIENIDVYPRCNVKIYDRTGRMLANINSYDNEQGWDGTYLGYPLPATDYWYVINLPEADRQLMGHFTLIR